MFFYLRRIWFQVDFGQRDVWKFFGQVNGDAGDALHAVCNLCQSIVVFDSENLHNLEDHLITDHQV